MVSKLPRLHMIMILILEVSIFQRISVLCTFALRVDFLPCNNVKHFCCIKWKIYLNIDLCIENDYNFEQNDFADTRCCFMVFVAVPKILHDNR